MVQSEFKTIILNAEEGSYLTQKADIEIEKRVIASVVALGKNDSASNWKEISQEEADAVRQEQEAARKARNNVQ